MPLTLTERSLRSRIADGFYGISSLLFVCVGLAGMGRRAGLSAFQRQALAIQFHGHLLRDGVGGIGGHVENVCAVIRVALQGEVIDLGPAYHSYTRREPFGVVGIILPWNVPINQAARAIEHE